MGHSHAFQDTMLSRIRLLWDAHLKLYVEKIGSKLVKTSQVCKLHNAELGSSNIVRFDVQPGMGIQVSPMSSVMSSVKV